MKQTRLRWLLLLCLAGTLALAWFAPGEDGVDAPTRPGRKATAQRVATVRPEAAANSAALVSHAQLAYSERQPLPDDIPDLFKSTSWYVPPPPAPAPPPLPPPKPTAPPLPFAFIGQYIDGNRKLIILTRGERLMTVSIGDVIDNTYKVESMRNGQLIFVYLPLSTTQALSTGVIQ